MPLPIVPSPFPDERLTSWLERIADVYLVSLDGLQAHVGWVRPALELELEPVQADMVRIAQATGCSINRLLAMTFHGLPPRYRSLLRPEAREICLVCSRGMQRPQRLRSWSFAFSFWCECHRQPLGNRDIRGASTLADSWTARRGAQILNAWAMGKDSAVVPVASVLSLLLSPARKASPAAPWELARLPPSCQRQRSFQTKHFRRTVLTSVVPEFEVAVPIYDQRLPLDISKISIAPRAERYALAIGVARVLKDPGSAIARILESSDEQGREKIRTLIDRWPAPICSAVRLHRTCNSKRGRDDRKNDRVQIYRPT